MAGPLIILDHLEGSRRGQRQEFALSQRIRFGRHPDSEVSFDAHRDLDASSRHAELRAEGDLHVLCDVGSSNGTFIDGEQITELAIVPEVPVIVEFGAGGPRLRLFIGDPDTLPALPASAHARRWTAGWRGLIRVSLIAAVLALVVAMVVALI